METDARNDALGAVLYQLNDQQEKEIVTLASRTLKGPELTYGTSRNYFLEDMQICKCATYSVDLGDSRLTNKSRASVWETERYSSCFESTA